MSDWKIPKLEGPTPALVSDPCATAGTCHSAPSAQQIEAILQQLGALLVDNYGARVTEVLTNGVCVTLRQRMHLMFAAPGAEAAAAQQE